MTQPLRVCAVPTCDRPARKRPWCTPDWKRLGQERPDLITAYARATGRREHGTEGAMTEVELAREAITGWLAGHPEVEA